MKWISIKQIYTKLSTQSKYARVSISFFNTLDLMCATQIIRHRRQNLIIESDTYTNK